MDTIDTSATSTGSRLALIAIVVGLALSFAAAFAALAETNDSSSGNFAGLGDYISEVGETLGSG